MFNNSVSAQIYYAQGDQKRVYEDEKNEYSFICSSIERPKKIEKIYMKEYKYINTTKKKFVDIEKGFYTNPGAILELKGLKTDEPSRNMKSLPYNPIELSE